MLHANRRITESDTHRTSTRIAVVIGLVVFGVLMVTSLGMSSRSVGAASKRVANPGDTERNNFRKSAQPNVSASNTRNVMSPALLVAIDVDRTDDDPLAAACTAAANDCSLRGAIAFANSLSGTTINVPAGTYQLTIPGGAVEFLSGNNSIGDVDVRGNNTAIIGAGAATTIFQQTQPNDRVLEINPDLLANFNFSISGVTLTGGKETTGIGGGGIISGAVDNTMSITNCVISGNSASGLGTLGGGAISHLGGSLTITGTTISNNSTTASGAGVSYSAGAPVIPVTVGALGTLTISGSTFSGNVANSGAAGGGAADLFNLNASNGNYVINSSTFSGNTAPNGRGGAIMLESGPLTLTTSSLSGNSAALQGGAIYSSSSAAVSFSRLVGNSVPIATNGLTLFSGAGSFTANDNWWGINTGPSANDFRNAGGSVSPASYLQLRISASPNEICTGATSTLTADIKQRNVGSPLTTELNGLPEFPAIFSNPVLGSISGATNFVNGVATATFTAGGMNGSGGADVTADNQTVTATVLISSNSTTDPSDQSVCEGQTASFSTTASGPGSFTFVWKKGATVLNDGDLGGRVTITSAGNTGTLSISNAATTDADTYTVEATGACSTSTQMATLTVNASTTATDPVDQTVCQGAMAAFSTTATGDDLHYAWTLDGSPFNGDSPSINVPTGALTVGTHTIGLTVTGSCGTVSHTASLVVQANTVASDPADAAVCQGATAGFATTASGEDVHYAWTLDGAPFNGDSASINVPTGSLSVGDHTIGLTVTGTCGTVTHSATLTVQAPTATTDPSDVTECQGEDAHFSTTASGTGPFSYAWTLDGSPYNGNSPSITIPTGALTPGNHTVQVTTTGTCGSATQTATLTVGGAPQIVLHTTTTSLWPPNHKYSTFNVSDFVASASSTCDPSVDISDVVIQKVTSDEPENGPGADGNTLNDIVIAPDCKSVDLRSERDGNLNGRVYTITFKVTDSFGNSSTATVTVTVPINNGSGAVDNGAAAGYSVNSLCP